MRLPCKIPRISFEATIGIFVALMIGILGLLHVQEPIIVWVLFSIAFLLIADSILRSKWSAVPPLKRDRIFRRVFAVILAAIVFALFGVWVHHCQSKGADESRKPSVKNPEHETPQETQEAAAASSKPDTASNATGIAVHLENKGTTFIGSIGQQGGLTFLTIIATNSAGASEPKLSGVYIAKNQPSGAKYSTTASLHIDSPRPVTLTVAAYGKSIESVSLVREGSSFFTGERREGKGYRSFTMENAYGNIDLIISSTTPEEFQFAAEMR
jgi:hypothetical protein